MAELFQKIGEAGGEEKTFTESMKNVMQALIAGLEYVAQLRWKRTFLGKAKSKSSLRILCVLYCTF